MTIEILLTVIAVTLVFIFLRLAVIKDTLASIRINSMASAEANIALLKLAAERRR
jgi:hypothetical protein